MQHQPVVRCKLIMVYIYLDVHLKAPYDRIAQCIYPIILDLARPLSISRTGWLPGFARVPYYAPIPCPSPHPTPTPSFLIPKTPCVVSIFSAVHEITRTFDPLKSPWGQFCLGSNHSQIYPHMRAKCVRGPTVM